MASFSDRERSHHLTVDSGRVGLTYGNTYRIANEPVRRGVLHRAGAPQDVGRPRVIESLTAAPGSGRTAGG